MFDKFLRVTLIAANADFEFTGKHEEEAMARLRKFAQQNRNELAGHLFVRKEWQCQETLPFFLPDPPPITDPNRLLEYRSLNDYCWELFRQTDKMITGIDPGPYTGDGQIIICLDSPSPMIQKLNQTIAESQ